MVTGTLKGAVYGLVTASPGQGLSVHVDDIYDTYDKAKWEWLEIQAARFRAGKGLNANLQVVDLYGYTDGTTGYQTHNGLPIIVIGNLPDADDQKRQAA